MSSGIGVVSRPLLFCFVQATKDKAKEGAAQTMDAAKEKTEVCRISP